MKTPVEIASDVIDAYNTDMTDRVFYALRDDIAEAIAAERVTEVGLVSTHLVGFKTLKESLAIKDTHIKKLKEALEFYEAQQYYPDNGNVARQALAEYEGEK